MHYIAYKRLLNVASVVLRPSVSHRAGPQLTPLAQRAHGELWTY